MSIKFNKLKICLDLEDQIVFGAHQGKTISYMLAFEPEYLTWCSKQPNLLFLTERAALALEVSVRQMKVEKQIKRNSFIDYDHDTSNDYSDWDVDVPF